MATMVRSQAKPHTRVRTSFTGKKRNTRQEEKEIASTHFDIYRGAAARISRRRSRVNIRIRNRKAYEPCRYTVQLFWYWVALDFWMDTTQSTGEGMHLAITD